MSFGDGDLHVANRRLREHIARLEDKVDSLKDVNGDLCREINRQERRIRELEGSLNDVADKWAAAQVTAEDASKRCVLLEALVRDLYGQLLNAYDAKELDGFAERMADLGIEVES